MTDEEAMREIYLIWNHLDSDGHVLSERLDNAITIIKTRMKALREIEEKYNEIIWATT